MDLIKARRELNQHIIRAVSNAIDWYDLNWTITNREEINVCSNLVVMHSYLGHLLIHYTDIDYEVRSRVTCNKCEIFSELQKEGLIINW